MKNIYPIFFLLLFSSLNAQDLTLHISYDGFLDNREYFNEFSKDQTFFGNRIKISNGFTFEQHSLETGFDYTYEFGSVKNLYKPHLVANYTFENDKFVFKFGNFNREGLLNYPVSFLNDSLFYYRPLIEGALLRFKFKNGHQQAWIDWTSRQTETIRETFLAGASGIFETGNIFFKNYILMYHYAKPKINPGNLNIRDNGGASLIAGYRFNSPAIFDSIKIYCGGIYSYDRYRNVYDVKGYLSVNPGFGIYYKKFGVNGDFVLGDGLVLLYGERIYRARQYARFDIQFTPFSKYSNHVFMFSVHLVEGKLNYSQLVRLKIDMDQVYYSFNKQ